MLWLQEYPWDQMVLSDYYTLMPNPHFNDLEDPLKLPKWLGPEMQVMVFYYLKMWIEYKKYDLKPWHWKGEVYDEDIRALEMLDIMYEDALRYKEAKKKGEQAMKNLIEEQKANAQGRTKHSSSNKGLWGSGRLRRK